MGARASSVIGCAGSARSSIACSSGCASEPPAPGPDTGADRPTDADVKHRGKNAQDSEGHQTIVRYAGLPALPGE